MSPKTDQQFRLASLFRYREQVVEERQQELHRLEKRLQDEQAALEVLQRRMTDLHGVIHADQAAGALDCEDLLRKFHHLEDVKQRVDRQASRVCEALADVDTQRERLLTALQDKQVLEKLKDRQMAEIKQEQTRKEGQVLDEIGGVRYHRKLREKGRVTRSDER